jgi:hypothetical protein
MVSKWAISTANSQFLYPSVHPLTQAHHQAQAHHPHLLGSIEVERIRRTRWWWATVNFLHRGAEAETGMLTERGPSRRCLEDDYFYANSAVAIVNLSMPAILFEWPFIEERTIIQK